MDKFQIGHSVAIAIAHAPIMSCVVEDSRNIITIDMAGAGTLNLSAASKPTLGDEIIVKVSSDATARDLTFGTGFTAPLLAGVINKTKIQTLVYDGSKFIASAPPVQIN